jgi:hypothetical protein
MDQNSQLNAYVLQSRGNGIDDNTIKNQLIQSGWQESTVNASLQLPASAVHSQNNVQSPVLSSNPHRVRNGVIWILSPFILLIGVVLLQLLLQLIGLRSPIINIIGILCGIAAAILIPVGPIIGIIKLTRH